MTALYWWLPMVWWRAAHFATRRSNAATPGSIWAFPNEARTYAETLLDTVDFLNPYRAPSRSWRADSARSIISEGD